MTIRLLAVGATLLAFASSAMSLLGWLIGNKRLTDWDGDGIAMLPNATIAATTAGAALLLLLLTRPAQRKRGVALAALLGALTALIGGLTLTQHIFGWNLGIDRFFIDPKWGERAAAAPGRMGPPASTTLFILGAALVLASAKPGSGSRRAAAALALLAILPPTISWTAYLYGADPLYSLPHLTGIAQQTASILFALAMGLMLSVDEFGLGALLRRDDAAGTLVRRLLPVSIILLLATGWLDDYAQTLGIYGYAFGNAALTVIRMVMFTALLWWTAHAVIIQIHGRKTVEAALSISEKRFGAMIDAIPQLAWMARADGSVYWYNQRWYEYTGTTPQQMEERGWQWRQDPRVLPEVLEKWKTAVASGEPFGMVIPLRGADGVFRPFLTRIMPVKDASGAVVQWFGTSTDISEQQAAETTLREANRIKDEFLATLSHELRTPMSAILGWAQMLRSQNAGGTGLTTTDTAQGLEVIERNARLQAQIIEDLLDMNRIISGKVRLDVQAIHLSDVVQAAIDAIRPSAEAKGLRVQLICDPHIDTLGDPNRLQQVFYNLLTNAVKFTPRGGKVQVTCGRVNSSVEVVVSDTGVGIKPDFLPHVFERFRQQDASTTRMFGGLGLGLGIVKHLVELHGGSVQAVSEGDGKGATFTVRLPVSIAVPPAPRGTSEGSDRHPTSTNLAEVVVSAADHVRGLRVLIVDDDADTREFLGRLLESHGCRPILAASASEALERLAEQTPDLMVCDIGMPVTSGYDLVQSIRALPPERGGRIPAIALTAFARSDDRVKSLRAGFQMHLAKPVETAELLASIANLANTALAQRIPTFSQNAETG